MPGDERFGAAVVVPVQDPVGHVILPDLNEAKVRQMDARIGAVSRDLSQTRGLGQGELRDLRVRSASTLDEVGRWAWSGVIGPLLDRHLTIPDDRPLRLALIPMRELTRVPWHAAQRRVDGRPEYAVSRISFSYAPSARMLCEAAWRPAVPLDETGLVVADPDTGGLAPDLLAARAEAQAIRQAFYPAARYLGRTSDGTVRPDGPGTTTEVLSWLADPAGGAMVHLAVHGEALGATTRTAEEASSYLLLAGTPGRLVAEEVIRVLSLPAGRQIALAVLAGCRTGESTRGYDEAFSIATALLAAGVRTVISSQWSVPDSPTSVLMYLFHHYLRERALAPVAALREAQLSMIEERPLPDSMPEHLRAHARDIDVTNVVNWAGFFHAGR
jgi:CHAT domain-containing protein